MISETEKWDAAANDYQQTFLLGLNEYNAGLLRFWQETGMLYPGARVLDIGCGVGKYGSYLAALGYDVTLTDISEEMLRHARENMSKYRTPWAAYRCDFNEITGNEPIFAGGFDLAVSTMSSAVHDADTVRKMSVMTNAWCFLARFYAWEQPLRDALMTDLGVRPRQLFSDLKGDCAAMIQAVKEAGFHPRVTYADYCWSDPRTPEQMADYLCRYYFSEERDRAQLYTQLLALARAHADKDGTVADRVNTKVAWIYWNTTDV